MSSALDHERPGLPGDILPSTVIVVPCYNEARRLPADSFREFLASTSQVHFLLVNDGSTDSTLQMLEGLRSSFPEQVNVLDKQPNAGKADAVRAGMLLACRKPGTEYVGFWDADLATPLDAIPTMLYQFNRSPAIQMVFGSRIRLLGRHVHRNAHRHYLGRVFATVVSHMLQLPIYDTQCGAKIFRNTEALHEVLSAPFLSRWIFDVEIIARFKTLHPDEPDRMHQSIYEFPLDRWEDMAGSKVGGADFVKAAVDLFRVHRTYSGSSRGHDTRSEATEK